MKKILGCLTVMLLAVLLWGCVGVQELTEEESNRISEYASTLLLKYDANYKNMLWEEEKKEEELPAEEEEKTEKPKKEEEKVSGQAVTSGGTEKEQEKEQGLAEIFGLTGVDIQYSGYEFAKSFPAEGKRGYMVQAKEGHKLLIIKLKVKNNMTETASVDILSGEPSFRIHFNEEDVVAQMTIILEDFSTMKEDIPAGAEVEKILVGEVPEDFSEQLSNLSIMTRFQGSTYVTSILP